MKMIKFDINPVLLHLGPIQIRYYGLFYVIGFIITYYFLRHIARKGRIKFSEKEISDFIVWIAFGLIIGARVFYFIFYDFSALIKNPLELFAVWNGGMSFHGGLIGVFAGAYLFCRKYKKYFWQITDATVIIVPLTLALGRIGNFINGELYGRVTDVWWAFDFGDGLPRHPSQLYEAAKNLFMFGILLATKDKKWPEGTRFALFLVMYGILRFLIEFVREPDPQLGFVLLGFTMGQVLCTIMVITGGIILFRLHLVKNV